MMRDKILLTALLSFGLALPGPLIDRLHIGTRAAYGQEEDPEVTRMAKQHYQLGLEAFKAGKYDVAIKELRKAHVLKRMPAILLNIGLTYRKMKDYDMAIYYYKKYLNETPPDDKQRAAAETAIGEIEAEKAAAAAQPPPQASRPAVEAAPGKPRPAEAVQPGQPAVQPGTPLPAPAAEWSHTPLDAVPPGKPIDVRVQMPVMKGVKVKVYFRKEGQATFDSLELKRRGNEKVARLPAAVTDGKTFQYYIEARDPAGALLKSSGSEASPNIVLIDAGARPQVAGAEAEGPDDEELAKQQKKGPTRDIENEQVTLDPKLEQERAMQRLRDQLGREETRNKGKARIGSLGYAGVGLMAGGLALLGGGVAFGVLAQQYGQTVSDDWNCMTMKVFSLPGGTRTRKCPHYGPNDTTGMNGALDPPTSQYYSQGETFDLLTKTLTPAGGGLLAGGTVMVLVDVLRRQAAERAASQPKAKPGKKRKVKKVIEVEEDAPEPAARLQLTPVLSPTTLGLVGELRF
jgi:hypothetical protein